MSLPYLPYSVLSFPLFLCFSTLANYSFQSFFVPLACWGVDPLPVPLHSHTPHFPALFAVRHPLSMSSSLALLCDLLDQYGVSLAVVMIFAFLYSNRRPDSSHATATQDGEGEGPGMRDFEEDRFCSTSR